MDIECTTYMFYIYPLNTDLCYSSANPPSISSPGPNNTLCLVHSKYLFKGYYYFSLTIHKKPTSISILINA